MAFMGAVRKAPARNQVFVPIARFSAEMCVFYDCAKAVNCLELVMPAVTSAPLVSTQVGPLNLTLPLGGSKSAEGGLR